MKSTFNCLKLIRHFKLPVAAPLGYFDAEKWLENFAYKIDLSIWIFIASGMVAVLIALGTVSFHAVKAALANPVKSLKSE